MVITALIYQKALTDWMLIHPHRLTPNFSIDNLVVTGNSTRNIRLSLEYNILKDAINALSDDLDIALDVFEIINLAETLYYDIEVTGEKEYLEIVVNWGGSEMKLAIYDPDGNLYGEFQSTEPPIKVQVQNPKEGTWRAEITAIEVPYNNYPFALAVGISPNQKPVADAGGPYSGTINESLTFDAGGSYDPDGTITLYEWDWDGDGFFDESTLTPEANHTWSTAFDGNILLMVTDDKGSSDTASAVVVITDPSATDDDQDGFSEAQGDCNDSDNTIYPGATEIPYDGIDQDCDGSDLTDVDEDGFDAVEAGGTDCNDEDPSISPDAEEVCGDSIDNNCNGEVDEGCVVLGDLDGDGVIGTSDYYIFLAAFGKCEGQSGYNAECDYDDDNCITFVDYQTWYGYYLNP